MGLDEIRKHLDRIEKILRETVKNRESGQDLKNKKEQFRIVDRSIRLLCNKDFPVPEEMNGLRNNLIAEIEKHSLSVAKSLCPVQLLTPLSPCARGLGCVRGV
jgi:hypothetical protein